MFYPVITYDQSFYLKYSQRLFKKSGTMLKEQLETKIAKAIDRDIAKVFQYLSADIMADTVKSKVRYFAGGIQSWPKLSVEHIRRKNRIGGKNVKLPEYFFLTGNLAEDLAEIPTKTVLAELGKTDVKIVKPTVLEVSIATKQKIPVKYAEKQLKFLDRDNFSAYKFDSGKVTKYRPLVGPYLQYYYNYQLIEVVRPLLEKIR